MKVFFSKILVRPPVISGFFKLSGRSSATLFNSRSPSSSTKAKPRPWSVTVPAPCQSSSELSGALSASTAPADEPDIWMPALSLGLAF